MDPESDHTAFYFVNSSDGLVPPNGDVRTQIRRQAMSRVAVKRKRRIGYDSHNIRQYHILVDPVKSGRLDVAPYERNLDLFDPHDKPLDDKRQDGVSSASTETESQLHFTLTKMIPTSMSYKNYDLMRARYDFDIADLSSLTSLDCGHLVSQALTAQPSHLFSTLRGQQWSYLSFLPCRYGNSTILDNAISCVVARIRQLISPPVGQVDGVVSALYSKALRSLQVALDDSSLRNEPDVLCATLLLALYELLHFPRHVGWIKHAAGAITLIKLRGPGTYNTDYEKALFLAHVGPIYIEAFINNRKCILEEDSWKVVLKSIVDKKPSFSSRSRIVIHLWLIIGAVPGVFKEVTDAVCNSKPLGPHVIDPLTLRIHQLKKQLSQWHQEYEKLVRDTSSQDVQEETKTDKRFETLGLYMANLINLNRLSLALNPLLSSKLEDQAQHLAGLILELEKTANAANPKAALFMVSGMHIARATIATEGEWRDSTRMMQGEQDTNPTGLIQKQVFERWCDLIGRKTCPLRYDRVGRGAGTPFIVQ